MYMWINLDGIILFLFQPNIQTNQKAHVVFRFIKQPEFIRIGARLLFREGRSKGMGEVTKILPFMKQECSR
jgi:GTPase